MLGPWHWKHLASSTSLPGASGNPGAARAWRAGCCARVTPYKATPPRSARPSCMRVMGASLLRNLRVLDHSCPLRTLALEERRELLRLHRVGFQPLALELL